MRLSTRIQGSDDPAPLLIDAIRQYSDGQLYGITQCEPNLEEIFLAATKRSWEETMDLSRKKGVAPVKT